VKYRNLGLSDLTVSEIGFDLRSISTDEKVIIPEKDAIRLLQEAESFGVNLFDTADSYTHGYGEEILAKALGSHRHDILIATRVGYDLDTPTLWTAPNTPPQNFDPRFVRRACEKSLRRLSSEYIDFYQLHNPRIDDLQRDDLFELLQQLVKEGKVRYYGIDFGSGGNWFEGEDELIKGRSVSAVQVVYSMLAQQPARELLSFASQEGIGVVSHKPYSCGRLTEGSGKSSFEPGRNTSRSREHWGETTFQETWELEFLVNHHPEPLDQLAITYVLSEPAMSSVLLEITSINQLSQSIDAIEGDVLCADCLEELKFMYDRQVMLADEETGGDR